MATLSTTNLTLADWSKRIDPDGKVAKIAMLLSQTNVIQRDAVHKEGNLPTGDRVSVMTGLPTIFYRALNAGIPHSKATTAQVDEACAILEARSEIDKDLAMLNGNTAEFRLSEEMMFLEGMNQAQATGLFYGNPAVDSKQFLGLMPRYNSLAAGNAQNIINGGGAVADQETSAWLIGWGDQTVYCPFPKGSQMGLIHEDLGEQTVYTESAAGAITASSSLRMQALVSRFQWKTGLVVKDWRYAVRICNLDRNLFAGLGGVLAPTALTNIIHLMIRATYRIPNLNACRPVWYVNRSVHAMLSRVALEKSQSALAINDAAMQFGGAGNFLTCLGIPIHLCDAITNTEAVVA